MAVCLFIPDQISYCVPSIASLVLPVMPEIVMSGRLTPCMSAPDPLAPPTASASGLCLFTSCVVPNEVEAGRFSLDITNVREGGTQTNQTELAIEPMVREKTLVAAELREV